jgi:hypothetical protein
LEYFIGDIPHGDMVAGLRTDLSDTAAHQSRTCYEYFFYLH